MVFKWNDQNTLLFLEHFKKYQTLWNHKIDDYKDRLKRAHATKSLITDLNLGITEEDVKHKIKSIRTRFTTELAKIKQSRQSGCSPDDVYVPTLYWFKHAEFLSSVCVPRQCNFSLDSPLIQNDEDSAESEQTQASNEQQNTKNSNISMNGSSRLVNPSSSRKPKKQLTLKRKMNMPIYRAIKELKSISEQTKGQTEDEFDLFCKSLAVQLKKMPLDRALICQQNLQSVMTQERLAQMSQSLPEQNYSDTSTPAPFTVLSVASISKYDEIE